MMQEKHPIEKQLSAACVKKKEFYHRTLTNTQAYLNYFSPPILDARCQILSLFFGERACRFYLHKEGGINKMLQCRILTLILQNVVIVLTCDRRGSIVTPAWPPTTGTLTSRGSSPNTSALKYNVGNEKRLRNSKDN